MNLTKKTILVVDDEPDIRELLKEILVDEGYEVLVAENAASAREMRLAHRIELILLDIWMPDEDGISLLKDWLREDGLCPVIMMSGHGTVETAVEATRLGAYDFLEKPLSMAKLIVTVERALEAAKLRKENIGLKRRMESPVEPIGKSLVMEKLRDQVKRLAQHDTRVLLIGEPGSGRKHWLAISITVAHAEKHPSSMSALEPSRAAIRLLSFLVGSMAIRFSMAYSNKPMGEHFFSMRLRTWSLRLRFAS